MKKNPFIFSLVIALCAACVFTSCNVDSGNSDSDSYSYSKETIEQLNKFEPGWWYVYETRKKVDNITGEETEAIVGERVWYLMNYDSNGKATGDYYGYFNQFSGEFVKVYWDRTDDGYDEFHFPAVDYKVVCKYIEDKLVYDRTEDYTYYKKFKLQKVNFDDEEENIPSWLEK